MQRLRKGASDAERTLAALKRKLPPEISAEVWSAVLSQKTLTVFVRSAAWGTRVRYVMPHIVEALAAELGAEIAEVKVKVRRN